MPSQATIPFVQQTLAPNAAVDERERERMRVPVCVQDSCTVLSRTGFVSTDAPASGSMQAGGRRRQKVAAVCERVQCICLADGGPEDCENASRVRS